MRKAADGELVREDAARVQASVPFRSENVDRDGFSVIVGLLVAFYYDSGRVDPLRALRRSNVDAYLMSRNRPTRRTARYLLYAAGRAFCPNEYPPALRLDAPRKIRTAPATSEEIAALYRPKQQAGQGDEDGLDHIGQCPPKRPARCGNTFGTPFFDHRGDAGTVHNGHGVSKDAVARVDFGTVDAGMDTHREPSKKWLVISFQLNAVHKARLRKYGLAFSFVQVEFRCPSGRGTSSPDRPPPTNRDEQCRAPPRGSDARNTR